MLFVIGVVVGVVVYTLLICGVPLLIVLFAGCNCGHPCCKTCERNRIEQSKLRD